jgi:hypothetical protein
VASFSAILSGLAPKEKKNSFHNARTFGFLFLFVLNVNTTKTVSAYPERFAQTKYSESQENGVAANFKRKRHQMKLSRSCFRS